MDPPQPEIFESWQPYKDFFCTDHQGSIVPDIDKIARLVDQYDLVIANCSTEHWGGARDFPLAVRLHDLLSKHYARDFVCLCHDPADEKFRENILYFPFFGWRKNWQPVDPAQIANCRRNYLFSNLNYFARDFRIINYLKMKSQRWADQCLITMHDLIQDNHGYNGHMELTQQENTAWQEIRSGLPCDVSDGFGKIFNLRHPAFADTYLHLVSETTIRDKIFLTEKTWQPILAGQLFLIWGNSGIVSHLRDLGVDVFDDIVDHTYDTINDHRARLERIHTELDRLSLLDWQDIYGKTCQRRQMNYDGFVTGKFISKYVHKVRLRLPKGSF